jgi:hypothetical protein
LQKCTATQSSPEDLYRLLNYEAGAVIYIGRHGAQLKAINARLEIIGSCQGKVSYLPREQLYVIALPHRLDVAREQKKDFLFVVGSFDGILDNHGYAPL